MRRALALLAIVCATGAGCGGDDGPDAEEQVRDVVREYLKALAEGRGERACGYLTEAARRQVVEAVTAVFPESGTVSCEEAIAEIALDTAAERKRVLLNPEIERVSVDGERATANVRDLREPLRLERLGDDWRVDDATVDG